MGALAVAFPEIIGSVTAAMAQLVVAAWFAGTGALLLPQGLEDGRGATAA